VVMRKPCWSLVSYACTDSCGQELVGFCGSCATNAASNWWAFLNPRPTGVVD
jgi:hypothetical protein